MNADCDSNASFGMRYGPVKMTAPMAAALPAMRVGADLVEVVGSDPEDLPLVVGRHRDRAALARVTSSRRAGSRADLRST